VQNFKQLGSGEIPKMFWLNKFKFNMFFCYKKWVKSKLAHDLSKKKLVLLTKLGEIDLLGQS
jgi:hypothetical protein